jgi:hypothetical protein
MVDTKQSAGMQKRKNIQFSDTAQKFVDGYLPKYYI